MIFQKRKATTNLNKRILWIIPLICIPCFSFSQSGEIKIRFIANAGLYMTDGNSGMYIDFPYKSGFFMYSEYDRSEITSIKDSSVFIFTHRHPDHYSVRLVRKLSKKHSGKTYGPWNLKKINQLNSSIQDFSIQPFKTKHRFSFKHCSYLITWHGKKIFISGDTEHAETIATIKDMDWAFVPAWLLMDAIKKNLKIDTKMIGLYHIGPKDKITTDNPKIHLLDKQGEIISVSF